MPNYKTVFFTLGVLQIILGVSMIIPIITQIIYGQLNSSFIGAGVVTIIFGILFSLSNLDHDKKLNLQKGKFQNSLLMALVILKTKNKEMVLLLLQLIKQA